MDIGITEAIIGGVVALAGGYLGRGVDWKAVVSKAKQEEQRTDSQVRTSELDRAAQMYREIAVDLRQDIDEVYVMLQRVEAERLDCRVENAGLKSDNRSLKAENDMLRAELAQIAKQVDSIEPPHPPSSH